MNQNVLVGKTIKEIHIADDRESIKFTLDNDESIIARCDDDCCSHTWIKDLINPELAINSEVLSADDIELSVEFQEKTKTDNYEEEMQYYGFAITTAKGKFVIAYRNSSNGYYGGNLSWPNEYYYGGVFGQNQSNENWVKL